MPKYRYESDGDDGSSLSYDALHKETKEASSVEYEIGDFVYERTRRPFELFEKRNEFFEPFKSEEMVHDWKEHIQRQMRAIRDKETRQRLEKELARETEFLASYKISYLTQCIESYGAYQEIESLYSEQKKLYQDLQASLKEEIEDIVLGLDIPPHVYEIFQRYEQESLLYAFQRRMHHAEDELRDRFEALRTRGRSSGMRSGMEETQKVDSLHTELLALTHLAKRMKQSDIRRECLGRSLRRLEALEQDVLPAERYHELADRLEQFLQTALSRNDSLRAIPSEVLGWFQEIAGHDVRNLPLSILQTMRRFRRYAGISSQEAGADSSFASHRMTRDQAYDFFDTQEDASALELKARYRELVLKLHPDSAHGDEEKMKRLVQAWEIIKTDQLHRGR